MASLHVDVFKAKNKFVKYENWNSNSVVRWHVRLASNGWSLTYQSNCSVKFGQLTSVMEHCIDLIISQHSLNWYIFLACYTFFSWVEFKLATETRYLSLRTHLRHTYIGKHKEITTMYTVFHLIVSAYVTYGVDICIVRYRRLCWGS